MVKEALKTCDIVLSRDEGDIEALCDRAEALISDEQYEEGIHASRLFNIHKITFNPPLVLFD